jgi:hypothetical protein
MRSPRLTGLTMWTSKPASFDFRRSSACPQPLTATNHVLAPRLLPDAAGGLVAIQPREADVEEHDLGTKPLGGIHGFQPVVRRPRLVAQDRQQHGEGRRRVLAVVDDEDAP